jgi:DNA polymerase I-like protein with 3'-5' exonuclease and polymerase domains
LKLIAFDVETAGTLPEYALQPFRGAIGQGWITSYATALLSGGGTRTDGCLAPTVAQLRSVLESCARHKVRIVGWNTPFDIAWLIAAGLRTEVYACQWLDAMLLWRHLTLSPHYLGVPKSYGLKSAVTEFYGELEAEYAQGIDFADESPEARARLLEYNKLDSLYTLHLVVRFLAQMPAEMKRAALIEAACLPMIAETFIAGLTVDKDAARSLAGDLELAHVVAFSKLAKSDGVTPEVLASPKQLANLLYQTWGLTAPKLTETGADSTDKESLQILALQDERAGWVRDYREAFTNKRKFCESPLQSVLYNGDGCTRPQAKIYGTYTGRMTYYSTQGKGVNERQTGIALHQWKREARFRHIICAPVGYTLIEFDFAGQEFRWMAVESGDERMLALCQPGEDAHSYMGAQVACLDYNELRERVRDPHDEDAKQTRYLGKFVNLSAQYRTSAQTLKRMAAVQYEIAISDAQAGDIYLKYRATYNKVPLYWNRAIYTAKKQGYAQTLAGRRVQLDTTGTDTPDGISWAVSSTAINFPIQGVGADQKYLALMMLRDYLPKCSGKFYFELHDGLFIVVPTPKAEKAAHEIRSLLSRLPYEKAWGFKSPIAFPVDAKWGPGWGALEALA